ncbi:MAG: outer membrane protein [Verrucomicrobiales bacterium]
MKTSVSTLAATSLMSLSAIAGEVMPMTPMAAAPMAPEYSWTGFYAGLQAGLNFDPDTDGGLIFDSNLDGQFNDAVTGGPNQTGPDAFRQNFDHEFEEALSYGFHLGYDQQMGRIVLGGILDYNKTNVSEIQSGFSSTPAFYKEERTLDHLATLRLRAGYLVTDRTLVYLTGGLAYGDPEYQFNSNNPNRVSSGDNDGDFGFVLGAGLETRLNQNWSLTLEYLYTNFGDGDFVTAFNNGPFASEAAFTNTTGSEDEFAFHSLQAKVSYRF